MADSAEPQASPRSEQPGLRYSAFISYNSRDAPFARRLHKRLETYRAPGRLAAQSPTVVSRCDAVSSARVYMPTKQKRLIVITFPRPGLWG